jgi:hypothetical protein
MYSFNGKTFRTKKLYLKEMLRVSKLLEEKTSSTVIGFGGRASFSICNPDYGCEAEIPIG